MFIVPNYLRMSHLQNLIDQNPMDDISRRARELMRSLPGHEPDPYSAGQDEIEQEVQHVPQLENPEAV